MHLLLALLWCFGIACKQATSFSYLNNIISDVIHGIGGGSGVNTFRVIISHCKDFFNFKVYVVLAVQ